MGGFKFHHVSPRKATIHGVFITIQLTYFSPVFPAIRWVQGGGRSFHVLHEPEPSSLSFFTRARAFFSFLPYASPSLLLFPSLREPEPSSLSFFTRARAFFSFLLYVSPSLLLFPSLREPEPSSLFFFTPARNRLQASLFHQDREEAL